MTGPSLSRPDGRSRRWAEIRAKAEAVLGPGLGRPGTIAQPHLHPTLDRVVATVEVRTSMEGTPTPYVAVFDATGTDVRAPGWQPHWSPDGARLAYLDEDGLRIDGERVELEGRAERLAWSPDGRRLLVVLAEPGSEIANASGSGLVPQQDEAAGWLPEVSGAQHRAWRRLVVVDGSSLEATTVGRPDLNIWNACWSGSRAVVAVCSDGSPTESAWYSADLRRIDVETGDDQLLASPERQLGAVDAAQSGDRVAWVEAVCSDRDIAAGRLHLLELGSGHDVTVDVGGDVTHVEFLDDGCVGFVAVRDLTTVVGTSTLDGPPAVLWESDLDTVPGWTPTASLRPGRVAFVRAGFRRPHELCLLRTSELTVLDSCATAGTAIITNRVWHSEQRRWHAPDGQRISGWLHLPDREGPHPLVVWVHGGPVLSHRTAWGLPGYLPWLLEAGYAVLQPNPRGSSGRGLEFAAAVIGNMGGADADDIMSGARSLIEDGIADPARIGVAGGSYGGYMAAWLVTQTTMFAAAVAMHPITDWVVQHGASNIGAWDALFLDGKPYAEAGLYRERSPMTHVQAVSTPTLFIAGRLDRATPPDQAVTMHRALVELGVPSDCVVHPREAHGARDLSAALDDVARVIDWFDTFMPATRGATP